ncbi:1-phosphofructokinase family hexose kinase [Microbacterium sp. NPDC058389]|uniref:1-phosphofructokinase family hexose kinase n=1 Tax=Microbacterium sp. NPDC058389 TaxID=3346475 RepID=UPI0036651453
MTIEDHPFGAEVHVHAGGQGVWQARMLLRLGVSVTMCAVLTGETGRVMRHLLEDEGIDVSAIEREGRGSAYIHDRRGGERIAVVEDEGEPIGRHELDELYGMMLKEGMASHAVILSGPAGEEALPADTYRRLASDLRDTGTLVLADLAGERLAAALEGGVDVLKVSHEELIDDGLIPDDSLHEIMGAMRALRDRGAAVVVVSRSSDPLLLLDEHGFLEVRTPELEVADTRGAGDLLTAGIAAGLATGESARSAVTLGAAAGAMNVTRHGLGSGDRDAIGRLREKVSVRPIADELDADIEQPVTGRVSPDGLVALLETEDEQ